MASLASQPIGEVTAHAQSDNLEDAREICSDGTYFPNNLRIILFNDRNKLKYSALECLLRNYVSYKIS